MILYFSNNDCNGSGGWWKSTLSVITFDPLSDLILYVIARFSVCWLFSLFLACWRMEQLHHQCCLQSQSSYFGCSQSSACLPLQTSWLGPFRIWSLSQSRRWTYDLSGAEVRNPMKNNVYLYYSSVISQGKNILLHLELNCYFKGKRFFVFLKEKGSLNLEAKCFLQFQSKKRFLASWSKRLALQFQRRTILGIS